MTNWYAIDIFQNNFDEVIFFADINNIINSIRHSQLNCRTNLLPEICDNWSNLRKNETRRSSFDDLSPPKSRTSTCSTWTDCRTTTSCWTLSSTNIRIRKKKEFGGYEDFVIAMDTFERLWKNKFNDHNDNSGSFEMKFFESISSLNNSTIF